MFRPKRRTAGYRLSRPTDLITARSITGGETYLSKHLRSNDYYAEGEEVAGEWIGKGAQALGLEGAVHEEHFEMLRNNLHPFTGEKLTARNRASAKVKNPRTGKMEERKQIAFHDITFSAPKAASIAALLGDDERITLAWQQSVRLAVKRNGALRGGSPAIGRIRQVRESCASPATSPPHCSSTIRAGRSTRSCTPTPSWRTPASTRSASNGWRFSAAR